MYWMTGAFLLLVVAVADVFAGLLVTCRTLLCVNCLTGFIQSFNSF